MMNKQELGTGGPRDYKDGMALFNTWSLAQLKVSRMRDCLRAAEMEAEATRDKLAKWMLPLRVDEKEKVTQWFGDTLLEAQWDVNRYRIDIRQRGENLPKE